MIIHLNTPRRLGIPRGYIEQVGGHNVYISHPAPTTIDSSTATTFIHAIENPTVVIMATVSLKIF